MRKRVLRYLFGTSDISKAGWDRTLMGLRTGEQRDLYLGLSLAAIAFLQRTAPRKQLLYRKEVPEGSALVIHHKRSGAPRIEVKRSD